MALNSSRAIRHKFTSLLVAVVSGATFAFPGMAHATGTATMYVNQLTPMVTGQTLTLQVRVNTGGSSINAVEADFTYPTSLLTYSSIDTNGSNFDVTASTTGGSGSVAIALGSDVSGGVSGDLDIANVNFTVAAAGTADIAFQGTSAAVDATSNQNDLATMTNGQFTGTSNAAVPVYRLRSRTGCYLYTTSSGERAAAVANYGYTSEGAGFYAYTSTDTGLSPVYRLVSSRTGCYLYTTSSGERAAAVANYGYVSQGIGFYASTSAGSDFIPIYRLNNGGHYLFTASVPEIASAAGNYGFGYEGVGFYASPGASSNGASVYRLTNNGLFLFTTSVAEVASAASKYGFVYQETAFDAATDGTTGLSPVYRLRSTITGTYLYTISSAERASAIANYHYVYEGIAFYESASPGSGLSPVYRLRRLRNGTYMFTTSAAERDSAAAIYGYTYEGIAFYAY